jgi:hypothetical protein
MSCGAVRLGVHLGGLYESMHQGTLRSMCASCFRDELELWVVEFRHPEDFATRLSRL